MLPITSPFERVGIVGLGLIGGAIALGLRQAWPGVVLIGVDRPEVLDAAVRRIVINERRGGVAELTDADLIILATPVRQIIEDLHEAARAQLRAPITDVGSTKREIMAAAAGLPAFVGGHPVSGSERGGLAHARANLFAGRPWLLVPQPGTDAGVISRIERMIDGLRAVPRRIDAVAHDRMMAYVSHLPQLLSSALMASAAEAVGGDGLALSGRGFADLTRLASSSADVWQGILATNGDFIAEALRDFVRTLPGSRTDLDDRARIDLLFARAGAWRDLLLTSRPALD